MKTIVAAVDFGNASLNAARYAADMATKLGGRLTLVHIYSIPGPIVDMPVPVFNLDDVKKEVLVKLDKIRDELSVRTGSKIPIHIEALPGDVIAQLSEYCSEIKPYAVVMGTETMTTYNRVLFGGNTLSALKKFHWPLIIIPLMAKFRDIKKIGLACDLREVIDSVRVSEIRELLNEFKAELHVLHVIEEPTGEFTPKEIEESGWLQEMLEKLNPKYHFLRDARIEKGLNEYAERNNFDLLIVIPKKHTLISQLLDHRHSKRLVLNTHVPVMSLHE